MDYKPKSLQERMQQYIDSARELGNEVLSIGVSENEYDAAFNDGNLGDGIPPKQHLIPNYGGEVPVLARFDGVFLILLDKDESLASRALLRDQSGSSQQINVCLYPVSLETMEAFEPKTPTFGLTYSASYPSQEDRIAALETKVRRLEEAVIGLHLR
jgi:hypothetical protein